MTRVLGRVRHQHAGRTYVVEMRADGITVRRKGGRTQRLFTLDHHIITLERELAEIASAKRLATKQRIRRKRDAGQLSLPGSYEAHSHKLPGETP